MFRLLIKEHNQTGLKYLCVTRNEDYERYPGSGVYWKSHLKKHGRDFSTTVLLETDDSELLSRTGLYYSGIYDIVESSEWANLIPETGYNDENTNQIKGWFGWYSSLSNEEIQKRNKNISNKVKLRIKNTCPSIIARENSRRRISSTQESKDRRKKKIQEVYATGKHDDLFKRYSEERKGSKNPAARPVSINEVVYDCIQSACDSLNLTRSIISRRLDSDSNQWAKWKRLK